MEYRLTTGSLHASAHAAGLALSAEEEREMIVELQEQLRSFAVLDEVDTSKAKPYFEDSEGVKKL